MKTKPIIILAIAVLITQHAAGQNYVDIARLHYNTSAMNRFENGMSATRVEEIGLDLTAPIVFNNKVSFLTGLTYEGVKVKLFDEQEAVQFTSVAVKAGFNVIHSARWSATYVLLPKAATDFRQATLKNFQAGGIALLKYSKRDNLKYKFGIYANTELFGLWIVPMAGLYYNSPDQKLEVNVTLPLMADVNYQFHSKVGAGMNFSGMVRTYHLGEIDNSGTPGYITKSTNELYAYLKFNMSKRMIVQAKAGRSFGRSYRVYNDDDRVTFGMPLAYFGDHRSPLSTDFEDGLVYQVAFLYRFDLANK